MLSQRLGGLPMPRTYLLLLLHQLLQFLLLALQLLLQLLTAGLEPLCVLPSQKEGVREVRR